MTAVPPLFYVDRSDRNVLRLTGRDRQSFLQGMVSNDVLSLKPGEGCYAFMLDATGHVLADMRTLCLDDALLLDLEPGMAPFVAETLDRYLIMEKCRIADVSSETRSLLVGGREVARAVAVFGVPETLLDREGNNAVADGVVFASTRLIPGPSLSVYCPAESMAALVERLRQAGAAELSPEKLESLRIEAGVPRFGVDVDRRVLAPETGQQRRAISYRKGCYIGQEIVARIDARGHTNRTLVGFRLQSRELPTPDTPVHAGEREVGRVTSATGSRDGTAVLALGYIRHEYEAPGTEVIVGDTPATVSSLPFVTEL